MSKSFLFFILSIICSFASYAQVLEYDTYITVDNGIKKFRESLLIQVNSPEELSISKVYIHHKADIEVKSLKAEIIDQHGKIVRKLKSKEVETKAYIAQGTFFDDNLYEVFDLAYNVFPYRFRYSYEITIENFIHLARWNPIYRDNVKTLKASLTVDLPENYKYNAHIKDIPRKSEALINGRKILNYESKHLEKIREEDYAPSSNELKPHVFLIPEDFYYGVEGNSRSWKSYGDWHIKLNEGLDYLTSSEKVKVDKIIEETSDTLKLVKKLYYHLQDHTRYINVAIDIGGLKPYSAAYVCTNKYGDCKALTIYMKALLKHAGINSNYTVINADDDDARIIEEFPFQQFNHVVLTVPINGDTLWLENTSDYLPFGYNGTFTQNRKALFVDSKESKLVNSPALSTEDVHCKRQVYFDIDESGKGSLSIKCIIKGEFFEKYSYLNKHANTKDFNTQVVRDFKMNDSEVFDYKVVGYNRDDLFMKLEINLGVQNQIRNLGSLRVIKPYVIELPELEKPMFRKNDLLVRYPINEEREIVYSLSANEKYNVELPDDILIETKYGSYKQVNAFNGTEIKINKHFKLFGGEYPQSDYEEFYNFFQSVNKAQKESIILENN